MAARTSAGTDPRDDKARADLRRALELLKLASVPQRLQILPLLSERERNVAGLCEALGIPISPAFSYHLALMRLGRPVENRRAGVRITYSLTYRGRERAELVDTLMR